jgi:hypothetical protein
VTATVGQVKTALAAAVGTITGLRTYDRQPDNLNAPFAFPSLQSVTYHGAMGSGSILQTYDLTVVVGRASERAAEDKLDTFLSYGAGSIREAIESDRTLGGVCDTCIVESANGIGTVDGNDTLYLSVDFRVLVYT